MDIHMILQLGFIIILATACGIELINKVPSTLHTPLMSGSNAISGITLLAAITLSGSTQSQLQTILAVTALIMATINVVGGYLVTERMLNMFQKKKGPKS